MPAFRRVEVWTDLQCAGGQRVAVLPDPIVLEPVYDLAGEESLAVRLPRSSPAYAELTERRIIRLVRRSAAGVETWEEWRISGRGESSGFASPPSDFTARPLRFDLGDVILREQLTDGTTAFSFSFTGLTLAEAFDAYILPQLTAAGKGYWDRGTFEATATFDDDVTDGTVLSVLRAWADRFSLEMAERADGATGYLVDLLVERGAAATMPRVETRKNLELAKRTVTTAEQATRVIPRGGEAGTEKVGIGAIRWTVTAVDGPTKRLTIADELGIVTPIAFDDQLNGWYVFREQTGKTFAIADTLAATQQLELSDVSTFAVGELISLRVADPNTNTLNWRAPSGGIAPLYAVDAVDGVGLRVTLADSVGGATDAVSADGDMVDWAAVFCDLVLLSVGDTNADVGGFYQVGAGVDLSSVQVGDIAFMDDDTAAAVPPFASAPVRPIGTVTAVDNVLKQVAVENRYDDTAAAIAATTVTGYTLRVYRPTYSRVVLDSVAASSEITLADVSSLVAGQLVEVRQSSGGVLPIALEAPAELAEYGPIERFLDVPTSRGETNLIPNPYMRTWSGATTVAPDQWALAGGATIAQTTDPEFTTLGGKAGLVDFGAAGGTLTAPAFRVWRIGTSTRTTVSLRVRLQFTVFSGACGLAFSIANLAGTPTSPVLRTLYPMDHPTAADADKFDVGVWYDLIITAINLSTLDLNQPLRLVIAMVDGAAGDSCAASIDAVQVTQTDYDPGSFIEGAAAAALWNVGNRYLEEQAAPLVEYAVQLRDLERLDGSPWSADEIILGAKIDLRDRDLGITATPRVVQYAPSLLDPLSSRVVLSNRQKTLARLLSLLALLGESNGAGTRSATQQITGAGTPIAAILPAPTIGPIYGEASARGGATGDGMIWLRLTFEKNTKEIWIYAELSPTSPVPTPDPHAENQLARVIKRQEGTIPNQDTWETIAFMATNPGWYKKVLVFGVGYDGTKGIPVVLEAQAIDAISPTLLDITDLAITRTGDTATITWTNPAGMTSSQPIYILLKRDGFVLQILPYAAGAVTVLDTELVAQNTYGYEVIPWSDGVSGATAPTDPAQPPTFTPTPVVPDPTPPIVVFPPVIDQPVITNTVIFSSYPGGNNIAFTYDTPDVPASGTATIQGYNPATAAWSDLSIPQAATSGGSYATTTSTAFNTFRAVVYAADGSLYAVGDTIAVSVP